MLSYNGNITLISKLEAIGLGHDIVLPLTSMIGNNWLMFPVLILLLARLPVEFRKGQSLAPIVFNINNKLQLYADVSAILVTSKDRLQIEQELYKELQSVSEWLVDNKLSLHHGKTESILFGSNIR